MQAAPRTHNALGPVSVVGDATHVEDGCRVGYCWQFTLIGCNPVHHIAFDIRTATVADRDQCFLAYGGVVDVGPSRAWVHPEPQPESR